MKAKGKGHRAESGLHGASSMEHRAWNKELNQVFCWLLSTLSSISKKGNYTLGQFYYQTARADRSPCLLPLTLCPMPFAKNNKLKY